MKFVILHGTKATPEDNWFPWLAYELEKIDHQTIRPQLPTPEGQTPENWVRGIEEAVANVGGPDEETVFVAHSMSPLAVCLYLEKLNRKVRAAFFIAGFAKKVGKDEIKKLNAPFVAINPNWSKVRANCPDIICFIGDDDPYVPMEIAQDFANKCGAEELIIITNGGHLSATAGFTKFPQLLEKIKAKFNI
ncbi:MAG: hypothetical protein UY40_C0001G0006 [candidate division CPR1 bacterium GW2011_GWC1_49_13]|uniref:Alpha/beta hydrolase n=1 Tax=candidate division CPR1 bacterium GW2011_GWC1_49_13 TaxID=1618342 RepID=A0A0G1VI94_9BACT|nr:MAG: hypothetical protein UY40_C0001G0006 [candidate division CPR1 bacterium GW2011_GWC1_49_13]